MIHVATKRFQLVLWLSEDRDEASEHREEFDTLLEAQRALAAARGRAIYRAGVLYEWHKNSGVWDLIEQL